MINYDVAFKKRHNPSSFPISFCVFPLWVLHTPAISITNIFVVIDWIISCARRCIPVGLSARLEDGVGRCRGDFEISSYAETSFFCKPSIVDIHLISLNPHQFLVRSIHVL